MCQIRRDEEGYGQYSGLSAAHSHHQGRLPANGKQRHQVIRHKHRIWHLHTYTHTHKGDILHTHNRHRRDGCVLLWSLTLGDHCYQHTTQLRENHKCNPVNPPWRRQYTLKSLNRTDAKVFLKVAGLARSSKTTTLWSFGCKRRYLQVRQHNTTPHHITSDHITSHHTTHEGPTLQMCPAYTHSLDIYVTYKGPQHPPEVAYIRKADIPHSHMLPTQERRRGE